MKTWLLLSDVCFNLWAMKQSAIPKPTATTGVLGTPYFDRSTSLAGGAFSTGSATQRILAQARLSF